MQFGGWKEEEKLKGSIGARLMCAVSVKRVCLFLAESYRDLFAFQYRPKESEVVKQSSGWALYDPSSEYSRMGVPNEHWRATSLNEKYEV